MTTDDSTATGGVTQAGGTSEGGATNSGGVTGTGGTGGETRTGGSSSAAGRSGGSTGTGGTAGTVAKNCSAPTSFSWTSSDVLIRPVSDSSHILVAVMEPTAVFYNGKYLVYSAVANSAGSSNLVFLTFADWPQANSTTFYYLDNNPGFSGNRGSPQLFYFTPQKKWYLIYQSGPPSYSTAADASQAPTWTKPATFFSSTPSIVTQNAGSVAWTDFWVICNTSNCFMFFRNDKGFLFRSQTSVGSFPSGFGTPVIVMQSSNANNLLQGNSVYKMKGMNKYLLLMEAAGTSRYFRSWTADAIDGTWTAQADSEGSPFAGASNVTFSGDKWTNDISHGQLLRDGTDETLTIDTCKLQFLFQGKDPYTTATGNLLPWKLGLLTKTN